MGAVRLVVSSGHNRPNVSGLYFFDGASVRLIDAYPCAGLSAHGEHFYRMAPLRQVDGAELLVYDAQGVCRYVRVDGAGDPHDLLAWDDERLLCVSSRDNAIVTIAPDGAVRPYWRAQAPVDAWHLNCLALRDDRLFATAFDRGDTFRGWHPSRGAGTGILFDVASGDTVVAGLSQPHTPRWVDGAWLICDSAKHEVVRVEPGGARFPVHAGGFTRGMCAIGEHVYVGVSSPRDGADTAKKGWICVLDRERWREVDRIAMPCSSMYDLIEVSEATLRALEAGFRVGSTRERYRDQLAMFEQVGVTPSRVWAIGEPLAPSMCRIAISAELPRTLALGDVAEVACTVENAGDGFLISAPPYPTEACYRWFDARGAPAGAGTWLHTRLPRTLAPRDRVTFSVLVAPPPETGRFTLRLTLLQEGVVWFDDVDLANAVRGEVEIVEPHGRPRDTNAAFEALPPDERRALARRAAENREPLRERWAVMTRCAPEGWHTRAAAAAAWLSTARSVADLGCGAMTLERYLAPDQRYVPVDLVARDERTIVLDLERDDLAPAAADACALLGVLGYLFDPLCVLRKVRATFARAVVSYNFQSEMELRLANGWVNHLDRAALLALFEAAGLRVEQQLALSPTHSLFELVPRA
jgi:Domain of unknown function (DUF4915)